jgi:glucose-1-phosphate thymidylyltransferase
MIKNKRKGIILSGGLGTRLFPSTLVTSKQLIPIYDKPMIYYPLSILMLAEIRDILMIVTPRDLLQFKNLLGDGKKWGIKISYIVQKKPKGLADALIISEKFLSGSPSVLILGDNIFYGSDLESVLLNSSKENNIGATIFAYHVNNPSDYGIVNFGTKGNILNITEKPKIPKSNYAVTGLYFYDGDASKYAKKLKPSKRNELEITDLNNIYLKKNILNVIKLGRGNAWLDTGMHENIMEASNFIYNIEKRQGLKICCPEEIAFKKKWISKTKLMKIIKPLLKNDYGKYLKNLI